MTVLEIPLLILCLALFLSTYLFYRKYVNERKKLQQSIKRIRDVSIINEYISLLNSTLQREEVLDIVVEKVKELLKAEKSAIILVEEGKVRDFYSSLGPTGQCKTELTGTVREVFSNLCTIRTDDLYSHDRFKCLPKEHPQIKSVLMVPILLRGKPLGVVIAADRQNGGAFTADDEDLLLNFAFHAALALEKVGFYEEVKNMASRDGLTGLLNHRTFQERLKEEIDRARRFGQPLCLLMMDIDRFKDFNDTFGHLMGDEILRRIGGILSQCLRSIDIACRYGGEEFGVILPGVDIEGARTVAERIRREVEGLKIPTDGGRHGVTISIGIATFPEDAETREELIDRADKALYLAKRTGRNRICTYREEEYEDMYRL